MPTRCVVPTCTDYKQAADIGIPFHSFPKDDTIRRQWLVKIKNKLLGVNQTCAQLRGCRVCGKHFKPSDYEDDVKYLMAPHLYRPAHILKYDAVPSILEFEKIIPPPPVRGTYEKRENMRAASASATVTSPTQVFASVQDYNNHLNYSSQEDIQTETYLDGSTVPELNIKMEPDHTDLESSTIPELYIKMEPDHTDLESSTVPELSIKSEPDTIWWSNSTELHTQSEPDSIWSNSNTIPESNIKIEPDTVWWSNSSTEFNIKTEPY